VRAVPPTAREAPIVNHIADELRRLAQTLTTLPAAMGGEGPSRTGAAEKILTSLRNVNATLEKAAKTGTLSRQAFDSIGRDFETIGATLRALGSGSKSAK
jgi:hypothetical protein